MFTFCSSADADQEEERTEKNGYNLKPQKEKRNVDRDDHTKQTHSPPTIEACLEKYAPYLADENISETKKQALIEALWNVICGFIQLGFSVTPIDHISPCGKPAEIGRNPTILTQGLVQSNQSIIEKFVSATDEESAPPLEGVNT